MSARVRIKTLSEQDASWDKLVVQRRLQSERREKALKIQRLAVKKRKESR